MAFDVSGLTTYIEENKAELTTATVLGAKMMKLVTVMPNVKGTHKLPQLSNTIFLQEGSGCGFDASGTTAITQRSLVPGKVKVDMEWCPDDLETIYLSSQIRAGATYDAVEPADVWRIIVDNVNEQINAAVDQSIWKGDTTTGTGNNQYFNGFIDTIGAGFTDANTGGTPLTTLYTEAAAGELVERIYRTASAAGLSDTPGTLFVGYDTYAWIYQGLVNGGSTNGVQINSGANGDPDADMSVGLTFPGYNMKIIPVQGLNGEEKAYFGKDSNMFIGVDAEADFNNMNSWYSQDQKKVRLQVKFKVATQVAFPAEIVAISI